MSDYYDYRYKAVEDVLPDPKGWSLRAAQSTMAGKLQGGQIRPCPCCGQKVKIYKRKLNANMARWLIWLVKAYRDARRWWSVNEGPVLQNRKGGGDFAKLVHWGLIREKPNEADSSKRTSGFWKPTKKGALFARMKIEVPSHVHLYNNEIVGWSDTPITIENALGKRFNYRELMRS
jgi:hypothetical protein